MAGNVDHLQHGCRRAEGCSHRLVVSFCRLLGKHCDWITLAGLVPTQSLRCRVNVVDDDAGMVWHHFSSAGFGLARHTYTRGAVHACQMRTDSYNADASSADANADAGPLCPEFLFCLPQTSPWSGRRWTGLGWAECGRVPYLLPILLRASRGLLINAPFLLPGVGLGLVWPCSGRRLRIGASPSGLVMMAAGSDQTSQASFPRLFSPCS